MLQCLQPLWINLVTTVTLAISLAFEPIEENTMKIPPRKPSSSIIDKYFIFRILFVSAIVGGITLYAFNIYSNDNNSIALAQTISVNTLVIGELFYLFNCRKIRESTLTHGFFKNKAVFISSVALVILQLSFNYLPFLNTWFGSKSTTLIQWAFPILCGMTVFILVEIEKIIVEKLQKSNNINKKG